MCGPLWEDFVGDQGLSRLVESPGAAGRHDCVAEVRRNDLQEGVT